MGSSVSTALWSMLVFDVQGNSRFDIVDYILANG